MNELHKILQSVRQRKAAQAARSAASSGDSGFNVEAAYRVTNPQLRWELSDVFGYTETATLAAAERPWRRWLADADMETWSEAPRSAQQQLVTRCLDALGEGDAEAIHVLLYTLRGPECEARTADARFELCRDATELLAECLSSQLRFRTLAYAVVADEDPCAALSVLLLLLTLQADRVRHLVAHTVLQGHDHTLLDVLLASTPHLDGHSLRARKSALLVWRVVVCTMGTPEDLDARKVHVRQANHLPPLPGPKSRRVDLEDMQRRVDRLHDSAMPPVALQEAMSILQRNLHIPTSALREYANADSPQGSRTLSKVMGSELKKSREHGGPLHLSSFVSAAPDRGKRRGALRRNVLPFELWYRRALPHLRSHMMGLVKLLVVGVMECFRARDPKQPVIEQMDARRHSAVLGKACASTLLLLLRLARENHVMQHEHLLGVYIDCDLMMLLLRFLQLDVSGLCLQPHWMPNDALHFLFTEPEERPHVNWNMLVLTVSMLQLLQKMTKHSLMRVRELMRHKGDRDLKKMLQCHPTVRLYALKILKSTLRLVKVKKRAAEGPIITAIFMELTTDLNDDWLTCWYLEQDEALLLADEMVVETEARAEVDRFNEYHYGATPLSLDEEEADDDDGLDEAAKVQRRYDELMAATPAVTSADFPRGVSAWLAEEVFCFAKPVV